MQPTANNDLPALRFLYSFILYSSVQKQTLLAIPFLWRDGQWKLRVRRSLAGTRGIAKIEEVEGRVTGLYYQLGSHF